MYQNALRAAARLAARTVAGYLLVIHGFVLAGEAPASAPMAMTQPANSLYPMDQRQIVVDPAANASRNVYYGDLHVHTTYSFDAFAFGTLATPYDAYRYAKGEAIKHPGGFDVQLREPLDFYAVSDHAMFLGVVPEIADPENDLAKLEFYQPFHNLNAPENMNVNSAVMRRQAFSTFIPITIQGLADGVIDLEQIMAVTRDAWIDIVRAAEEHYEPGKFTTFIAYEYTSTDNDRGNLHRNVIFRGDERVPVVPFSRFHSQNPEGLWDWMDHLRELGIETLSIPHNSNGSNGSMFMLTDWAGKPFDDAYADQRMRNEPIVEITQVKGTSEAHPALSPNDEWADFEIMPYRIATQLYSEPVGSYVRTAYRRGLELEAQGVANPYKFGVIGSSDTHTGATSDDEANFFSKVGLLDSTSVMRGSVPLAPEDAQALRDAGAGARMVQSDGRDYMAGYLNTWGASGLAAVWAEENTREAIFDAFRRKETFATTGPRMRLRFFASHDFSDAMLEAPDMLEQAYAKGVTMGSDLIAEKDSTPRFLVWAMRDPVSAPLQRLQVVKGWVDAGGESSERVYDVACSDGLEVDPGTDRCPDNGAKVNLADCSISKGVGASELLTLWEDPDFDPKQRAFYYVRALENPTCRWSTWDAVKAGVAPRSELKKTIQERAYSSPIWYVPGAEP